MKIRIQSLTHQDFPWKVRNPTFFSWLKVVLSLIDFPEKLGGLRHRSLVHFNKKKWIPFQIDPHLVFCRSSGVQLYGTLRLFRRYGASRWVDDLVMVI